ncbi:MAG: 23S rRNA (guanosine(2251)-2'-O)-methyltransferase RlmB [Chloroflexi bacterium]|nr:23S rRNA (guanosine(2251)-2'-O)-methyltransferase RlmB [Chloroflexota bacterium]
MEWLTGRNPVYEALRANRRVFTRLRVAEGAQAKGRLAEILDLAGARGIKSEPTPRPLLDRIADHHQGVALEAGSYPYSGLLDMLALAAERGEPPFILLLDTLQDPQNLGTLLRTAEAVGAQGVVIPLAHTASITPAVVSASSGASEHLLVAQANLAQTIQALKENDVWVVGLDGGSESQPPERVRLDGALALVVGNEGEGMRRLVRESCDILLALPMRGEIESLNAAVAGSVALYLAWQARKWETGQRVNE